MVTFGAINSDKKNICTFEYNTRSVRNQCEISRCFRTRMTMDNKNEEKYSWFYIYSTLLSALRNGTLTKSSWETKILWRFVKKEKQYMFHRKFYRQTVAKGRELMLMKTRVIVRCFIRIVVFYAQSLRIGIYRTVKINILWKYCAACIETKIR